MADVYTKLRGIIGNLVRIGGAKGPQIGNNSGVIEALANASSLGGTYAQVRAADATGSSLNDVVNVLLTRGRVADIHFGFVAVPTPNTHPGKFGFCQTTCVGFTEGDVVYDNGTTVQIIPAEIAQHLTTQAALTNGNINLDANSLYSRDDGTTWTKKGGGTAASGTPFQIIVDFDFSDQGVAHLSAASVPDGSIVENARLEVVTAFNGTTPEIAVIIDGTADTALIDKPDNSADVEAIYDFPMWKKIDANHAGPVSVMVYTGGGTMNAGVGRVVVEYSTPLL